MKKYAFLAQITCLLVILTITTHWLQQWAPLVQKLFSMETIVQTSALFLAM